MQQDTVPVEEITRRLGLCQTIVYRQLAAGVIPSKRIGRRYVVPREMFESWIRQPDTAAAGE